MTNNNEKSAYAILGLHKGATVEEIKQAYVMLVKKFDPERHTERFMMIQKAFDRLKDAPSRAREDIRTFNYLKGEFFFKNEEKTNAPDAQVAQAIHQIERKKAAGEIDAKEADAKLIHGYMVRSYKNVQKKLWAEAIQDWQRVVNIDPSNQRAKNNLMFSYMTLGYSYANHGLYEEAIEVWSKAAQMDPDNHQIIHNLALACDNAGHKDDAARYWKETIKRWKAQYDRQPDNEYLKHCIIELHRQYGEKLSATSETTETRRGGAKSIEDYREILKLDPNDFEAHFKIASQLVEQHQWAEAIKEFEDLARKFPRNIEVLNLYGWALLNDGQVDNAFTNWRKAYAIDPKNYQITESLVRAHMTMGRTLRDKGLYTPCLVHFKALLRYLPNSDEVHFEIGKTYQLKGDERSAYQEFQRVLEMNPKHKDARNCLSSIKLRR